MTSKQEIGVWATTWRLQRDKSALNACRMDMQEITSESWIGSNISQADGFLITHLLSLRLWDDVFPLCRFPPDLPVHLDSLSALAHWVQFVHEVPAAACSTPSVSSMLLRDQVWSGYCMWWPRLALLSPTLAGSWDTACSHSGHQLWRNQLIKAWYTCPVSLMIQMIQTPLGNPFVISSQCFWQLSSVSVFMEVTGWYPLPLWLILRLV